MVTGSRLGLAALHGGVLAAIGFAGVVRPGHGVDRNVKDAEGLAGPANHRDHRGRPSGAGG